MPIQLNPPDPNYRSPFVGPDIGPNDHILFPTSISQEEKFVIPANFDDLPPEEQQVIMMKARYGGIRCRNDIKTQVPVSGQTMDL
jgi:hypothetical protein